MSLHDRLTEDLKLAMKARDQLRMDVIRMIKAAVMNKEMEIKKDLDDAAMSRVMTTMIKQRRNRSNNLKRVTEQNSPQKNDRKSPFSNPISLMPSIEQLSSVVDAVIQKPALNL
jgi:hypothetical protein